jgi:hypothetical protein
MQNAVRLDNAGGFTAIATNLIQPGSRIYLDKSCDIIAILYFRTRILYHKVGIKQNISTVKA